jgi:hypothetical protein
MTNEQKREYNKRPEVIAWNRIYNASARKTTESACKKRPAVRTPHNHSIAVLARKVMRATPEFREHQEVRKQRDMLRHRVASNNYIKKLRNDANIFNTVPISELTQEQFDIAEHARQLIERKNIQMFLYNLSPKAVEYRAAMRNSPESRASFNNRQSEWRKLHPDNVARYTQRHVLYVRACIAEENYRRMMKRLVSRMPEEQREAFIKNVIYCNSLRKLLPNGVD